MFKILYDFNILSDHTILAKRSDIVVIDKKLHTVSLIDILNPADYHAVSFYI